ncbi:MAG: prepilin-type N-terminal cleavage/methylation domain-containing protein [Thermoguttaceae bacterium]
MILAAAGWQRAFAAERELRQQGATWEATALALKEEFAKRSGRAAMTLIELLVAITIAAILAGLVLAAYRSAQEGGRSWATRATIAKLNNIIAARYESYITRRVPIRIPAGTSPAQAARMRLDAIRDLMRMEMPDARSDVMNGPIVFTWGSVSEPALHRLYAANPPTAAYDAAQCLYKVVSMGSPAEMEQFHQQEIGAVDGKPVFVDGWGNPIMWFRWAPGFVAPDSEIQSGDSVKDHDPFDSRKIEPDAFRLIPLIYSGGGAHGVDGKPSYGLDTRAPTAADIAAGRDYYVYAGNPYNLGLAMPIPGSSYQGNIDNHHADRQ